MFRRTYSLFMAAMLAAPCSVAEENGAPAAEGEPAAEVSQESVRRLMRQLEADRLQEREEATRALMEIGAPAVPALMRACEKGRGEVQHRATQILREIERRDARYGARWSGPTSTKTRPKANLSRSPPKEKMQKIAHPLLLYDARKTVVGRDHATGRTKPTRNSRKFLNRKRAHFKEGKRWKLFAHK